jgi:hypothetical protein
MPHAYTEDEDVKRPATKRKAEGERLKADVLPPEAITAAVRGVLCERRAGVGCNSRISSGFLFE